MDRSEWFSRLADAVVAWAPQRARTVVSSIPDLEVDASPRPNSALGPAVVVARIAQRYSAAQHPDEIAAWLSAEMVPDHDDALAVVVPICEAYRSERLPVPRFWRPDELFVTLLQWYARGRATAHGVPAMSVELARRWGAVGADDAGQYIETWMREPGDEPTRFAAGGKTAVGRQLQRLASSATVRAAVDQGLGPYPPELWERDDLVALARHTETLRAIDSPERMEAEVELAWRRHAEGLAHLTPCERSLLVPEQAADRDFARIMEHAISVLSLADPTGVNALPDRVQGTWRLTRQIADYVYNDGGRIRRSTVGPMAHWLIVLETLPEAIRVAQMLENDFTYRLGFPDTSELAQCVLVLPDQLDDPMHVPFTYYADEPQSLIDLVVLLQTERARLDILAIDDDGSLVGVGTIDVRLPDAAVKALRERIAGAAHAFVVGEPDRAPIVVRSEDEVEDLLLGEFVSADTSKSIDLLAALDPRHLAPGGQTSRDGVMAVRDARAQLLDARIAAAHERIAGEEPDELTRVPAAELSHADAVARMRGPVDQGGATASQRKRAQALVAGLVDQRSAILHLRVSPSGPRYEPTLQTVWISRTGRKLKAHQASLAERLDLEGFQRNAQLPLSSPEDFDGMIAAAPNLGRLLVDDLREQGIRRVTLCPVSFLHAIPIHCWPLDPADECVLDVFDRISYAPSAGLLQQLRSRTPPGRSVAAAAHGPDLRYARNEARVLSLIAGDRPFHETGLAPGDEVGGILRDAGILHLSCHGSWFLDDYWRSGIALAGAAGETRWVSVGEIQRDLDLRSTELVGLLACDSGVSAGGLWGVDEYAGIDGAFLIAGARAVVSTLWRVADPAAFLFAAAFYHALSAGSTVYAAYERAIRLLRTGAYRDIDPTTPLGALMAASGVDWPSAVRELDDAGIDLRHPFFWAVFKLSGIVDGPVRLFEDERHE